MNTSTRCALFYHCEAVKHLRSPHLANAKIHNLRPLFSAVNPAYALTAHPHGESGLVTSDSLAHTPRLAVFFVRTFQLCAFYGLAERGGVRACK